MIFTFVSYLLLPVIGAITLFYLYAKYQQTYWSKRGIYSPPCHWLFGHFADGFLMKKSFPQAFADVHNSIDVDAPVVGVYVLQKPFLLLRDLEVIKHVLIKDFHIFSNRYFATKRETHVIGCKNLFSITNPQWKYIRSKLPPAFTTGKLKNKLFELDLVRAIQIFTTFFYPTISDYLGGSMLDKSNDYFRRVFWESMNEREKSGTKVGDIIDLLIDLKNEKQSSEFELAKNAQIQERARQEIHEKLSGRDLTYGTVLGMTYLNQVVSETLRIYPPAPLIDRVASQDYKVPGTDITIDKGTAVYATLMGLHQDPRYYSNPSEYDPDRFSEEQKTNITPCTYMPFGEGPRICIGMKIGQIQTLTGLAAILNEYKVTLNPKYKNELSKRSMLLAPADDGVRLYFTKL